MNVSETCLHPLARTVWHGDERVWCWACRMTDDAPRLLSEPEAWMVIERWRALGAGRGILQLLRDATVRKVVQ